MRVFIKILMVSLLLPLFTHAEIISQEQYETLAEKARNFGKVRYLIVLDSSGSMRGHYSEVRKALVNSLYSLKAGDVITLMHFNSEIHFVVKDLQITEANRNQMVRSLQKRVMNIPANGQWTDLKEMLAVSRDSMEQMAEAYPDHMGVYYIFSDNIDDPPPWAMVRTRTKITEIYDTLARYRNWGIFGREEKTSPEVAHPAGESNPEVQTTVAVAETTNQKLKKAMQTLEKKIGSILEKGPQNIRMDELEGLKGDIVKIMELNPDAGETQTLVTLLYDIEQLGEIVRKEETGNRGGEVEELLGDIKEQKKFIKITVGEEKGKIAKAMGGTGIGIPATGTEPLLTGTIALAQYGRWVVLIVVMGGLIWLSRKIARKSGFLAGMTMSAGIVGLVLAFGTITRTVIQGMTTGSGFIFNAVDSIKIIIEKIL